MTYLRNICIGAFFGLYFVTGFFVGSFMADSVNAQERKGTPHTESSTTSKFLTLMDVPPPIISVSTVRKVVINEDDENIVVCWKKQCKRLIEVFPKPGVIWGSTYDDLDLGGTRLEVSNPWVK